MLEKIRSAFYTDTKMTSILISFLGTLILGFPVSVASDGGILSFELMVFLPMTIVSIYREKRLATMNLRDYNLMNILLTMWLPLLITVFIIFG